jgi:hypothetical protein
MMAVAEMTVGPTTVSEKNLPFEVRRKLATLRADRARFVHGLAQTAADRVDVQENLEKLDRKESELQTLMQQKDDEINEVLRENGLK